jgi:hypothetical protein
VPAELVLSSDGVGSNSSWTSPEQAKLFNAEKLLQRGAALHPRLVRLAVIRYQADGVDELACPGCAR